MDIVIRNSQRLIRIHPPRIEKTLRNVLRHLARRTGDTPVIPVRSASGRRMHIPLDSVEIGILFVNDRRIREMNRQYRGIDRVTDVLSFSQLEETAESPGHGRMLGISGMTDVPVPFGDIIIGLHQARRQAKEYGLTLSVEISRLLVHGLLHLMGYDHEKGGSQARTMRAKERELLGVLGITL